MGKWRFDHQKEKQLQKKSIYDLFRGKSCMITKIAVTCFATVLGIAFIVVCVYTIIPSMIFGTAKQLEQDIAIELYERTIQENPYEDTEQVFEQSEKEALQQELVSFPRDCFTSVLIENPDIVGRISIDYLDITYLVTQSKDNEYYLGMGYDRKESNSGTIFLDYRSNTNIQPLKGHYILYGHNMKNGSMFHNITEYKNEDIFNNQRIIQFDTLYQDYKWVIFSAYVTDTNFYFIDTAFRDDDEWLEFLSQIQQKSMFKTNVQLSADDVVLTLCTCSYEFDDAHFVIHAKLIK